MEYLRGLPWKDWAGPMITACATLLGGFWVIRSANRWKRIDHDQEQSERASIADTSQSQDLTARLQMLMNGYEARIKDMSADLIATKDENRALWTQIEVLRRGINGG